MITLINASAFRSDEGRSSEMTPEGCQKHLAQYASSKIRLWAYHCSLSRLVLSIDRPASESVPPIDLLFFGLSDIRCPVHWVFGAIEICQDSELQKTVFTVSSAGVSICASDLTIVVQDEYPNKLWELDTGRIAS
jgi:hypothetical protein